MNARTIVSALALGLSAMACSYEATDSAPAENVGTQASAATMISPTYSYYWWVPAYNIGYAFSLNGRDLNGRSLNGDDLTGRGVLGVSLTHARDGRRELEDVRLEDTTFRARKMKGDDFIGVVFDGVLEDGSVLPVRIDKIHEPSNNEANVTRYTVSYQTDKGWKPFCGRDNKGKPVKAIPLAGRWDYREGVAGGGSRIDDPEAFTFACDGYALAKCVDHGYQPWLNVRECKKKKCPVIPMKDLHQACTRAVRADYCGDGTSYTNDGELINVSDDYGIRIASPRWPLEAEWDASGARCAVKRRVSGHGKPSCWNEIYSRSCGKSPDFDGGTLLLTQDAP